MHARSGDCLVGDPQGNARLCDDLYFKKNYRPLGGSAPLNNSANERPVAVPSPKECVRHLYASLNT